MPILASVSAILNCRVSKYDEHFHLRMRRCLSLLDSLRAIRHDDHFTKALHLGLSYDGDKHKEVGTSQNLAFRVLVSLASGPATLSPGHICQ